MDPERIDFVADVLANILTRLPPNTRRRLRLVCRHWRDVIDTRTATNLLSLAKTLVATTGSAYIIDNLPAPGKPRELWTDAVTEHLYGAMSVVGTCNGLVCLCDDREIGGAVTVANPVTHEALSLPPLPPPRAGGDQSTCRDRSWHAAYSFAYLPASALYKVVHVPCHLDRSVYDTVRVITLGEASWRDVPAGPVARCSLGGNVVSVDGVVYWTTPEADKVMSFDLENESTTPIMSLPSVLSKSTNGGIWRLAEVRGRLAIIFCHTSWTVDTTEVWVKEGATGQIRWSRWYIVQMTNPRHRQRPGTPPSNWFQRLAWPLFLHGEHILTWQTEWPIQRGCVLCMHAPIYDMMRAERGVVDISETNRGTVITSTSMSKECRTFAYVETDEPLSVYKSAAV